MFFVVVIVVVVGVVFVVCLFVISRLLSQLLVGQQIIKLYYTENRGREKTETETKMGRDRQAAR